jgi:hypothetical protein
MGFGIILEKNGNLGNGGIIFDPGGVDHGFIKPNQCRQ